MLMTPWYGDTHGTTTRQTTSESPERRSQFSGLCGFDESDAATNTRPHAERKSSARAGHGHDHRHHVGVAMIHCGEV